MEVQIISREIIKPAILHDMPQNDQKTFKMSLLDMFSPPSYTPLILFYTMKEAKAHFNKEDAIIVRLKLSLSQTLAHFPMLGGKIKGNLIDCSNIEALFLEAKVKVSMVDFLKTPNLHLLQQFIPFPLVSNEPLEITMQVAAQVNFFSCGGIAIGLTFFHKIIDATTMSAFMRSWAASSNLNNNNNHEGVSNKLVCGNYQLGSSLFPPRELIVLDDYNFMSPKCPFIVAKGKGSTSRRFVFDAMAISNLKAKAKSTSVLNPTTVEAVTCFIWKCAMNASRSCRSLEGVTQNQSSKSSSVLIHAVNMRRRMQPTLPDRTVGNFIWRSYAYYELKEEASNNNRATNLADLESVLRQSLSEIDNDFIQRAISENGYETIRSLSEKLNELCEKSSESYFFTSWRNMGFKEVDFGWGKPVWNSFVGKIYDSIVRNTIFLMETTVGEGIEACIVLDDEIMSLLENDSEFLEFASPNPSVILSA